jgi:H+-transporting ATPase
LSQLESKLGSGQDGVSHVEAEKRLTRYGPNEIEEKKTNPILKFLGYLWGPVPWMIEAAVILSALVQHWPDSVTVLLLLTVNAIVGFTEERQADDTVAALEAQLAITATVKRDGAWARHGVSGFGRRARSGSGRLSLLRLTSQHELSNRASTARGVCLLRILERAASIHDRHQG